MFNDGEFGVYGACLLAWYHPLLFQRVYAYFLMMPDYSQYVSLFCVQQFEPLFDFLLQLPLMVQEVGLVVEVGVEQTLKMMV
jgi:hypothetical protein